MEGTHATAWRVWSMVAWAVCAGPALGASSETGHVRARPTLQERLALPHDEHSVNVKLRAGVSARDAGFLGALRSSGASIRHAYTLIDGYYCLNITTPVPDALAALAARADVIESAWPNGAIGLLGASGLPNDPDIIKQYGLLNTGQQVAQTFGTPGADIRVAGAWSVTTGDPALIIAVIDAGIDTTHRDIAPNIFVNQAELNGLPGVDDDQNGYIDDVRGWNFEANTPFPGSGYDVNHGTHVAGILGASADDGLGIAGVLWHARVLPLKILEGGGVVSDATRALEYALLMGAKISNNSWYASVPDEALEAMLAQALARGHLFVAAAGNDGTDGPVYPASLGLPNILAVAATDNRDQLAPFSSYSTTGKVHLGAPGVDIWSCQSRNRYASLSGTSVAAPFVAGVAGLVWSRYPDWTLEQVRARILATVRPLPSLAGRTLTGGLVDAEAALTRPVLPGVSLSASPASTIAPGDWLTVTATALPAADRPGPNPVLNWRLGTSGPFTPRTMVRTGPLTFAAAIQVPSCAGSLQYSVSVTGIEGGTAQTPATGTAQITIGALTPVFSDTLEVRPPGWVTASAGDTATTGRWEFGRPQATPSQSGSGHTPAPGVNCWATGLAAGASESANDVSGPPGQAARTTLISPAYDWSTQAGSTASLWRWFVGSPGDSLTLSLSNNNGTTWTQIERVTQSTPGWTQFSFQPGAILPLTSQMRLRWIAEDALPASVCEAGVDDLLLTRLACTPLVHPLCPADFNTDGRLESSDLFAFLAAYFASDPRADINGQNALTPSDIFAYLDAYFAGCPG